jgi:hypothetical protein
VDVLEMGVKYWQEVLARSQSGEVEKYKEAQLDKELEDFMLEFGISTNSGNVMDNF